MRSIFPKRKSLRRVILFLAVFVLFYLSTSIFYLLYKNGSLYLYSQKSDSTPIYYEARRKLLIKNLSFIDKFFVVGYHGGYVDGFEYKESWMKRNDYNESHDLPFLNKIIEDQGICKINGNEVNMYAYYYTYTFFGIPYNEYVITCKQVEITTPLSQIMNKKIIKQVLLNK